MKHKRYLVFACYDYVRGGLDSLETQCDAYEEAVAIAKELSIYDGVSIYDQVTGKIICEYDVKR